MPWKKCQVMEETLRLLARVLEGGDMSFFVVSSEVAARLATEFSSVTRIPVRVLCQVGPSCRFRLRQRSLDQVFKLDRCVRNDL
ncbi:hypothetical protein MCEMSE15_00629 [Fimbriimonadaceae bacterium]